MFKTNYSEIIRIIVYSLFLILVIFLPYSNFDLREPDKINEYLSNLLQLQALLISISFLSTSLLQSSFDVRVYGQKIIKTQANNILYRISSSLLLIISMSITVWNSDLLYGYIIFIISIFDVLSNFLVTLNILRKPHMHSQNTKNDILKKMDNYKNYPNNKNYEAEFLCCLDYLISHTKELAYKKNFMEVKNNQNLLNQILLYLICNNIHCIMKEYETIYLDLIELRNVYHKNSRFLLESELYQVLIKDKCMKKKHNIK